MNFKILLPALALAALVFPAQAQTPKWPDKPLRLIVPFPPGGTVDIVGRLIAPRLAEELGQPVIVDNRPGAAGSIGAEAAAKAAPDGYTMIVVGSSYASGAGLYKTSYDPVNGIAPISMIASGPFVLVVNPAVKANSLSEFLSLAKANPGKLNFASGGTGGASHLAGEFFRQVSKTDLVHVPYKGGAPALVDLLAGQVQVMFSPVLEGMPHIKSGKLRDLAVTSETRFPLLPNLPTVSEQVPGYVVAYWFGMWAPGGTPWEIVMRVNAALGAILKQPAVAERLRSDGVDVAHNSPDEFSRMLGTEIAKWNTVIKAGNITAN
ncbi:MAG: tripartite tricarboxylate transporter substrate binding protein [Betaproteobacteria bacterium]